MVSNIVGNKELVDWIDSGEARASFSHLAIQFQGYSMWRNRKDSRSRFEQPGATIKAFLLCHWKWDIKTLLEHLTAS